MLPEERAASSPPTTVTQSNLGRVHESDYLRSLERIPVMESRFIKKREGEQLEFQSSKSHTNKKVKYKEADYTSRFIQCLSSLSDDSKKIIRQLGFGSILNYSCFSNVDEIFNWLTSYLDTNTATLTFEDGFSFTISQKFANVIFAFPNGNNDVVTNSTEESSDFIHNCVQMESPTVEYLCHMLSNELEKETFIVVFMLLIVTVIIDPKKSGVPDPCYYPNYTDIQSISTLDWSSFMVDCLMKSIKKHQFRTMQGIQSEVSCCKILLVISYCEFLITSEFNMGLSLPRLPLWSTYVVNSFIHLDSKQGQAKDFGKLARKHITSTPFKGSKQEFQMPAEIRDYMNAHFAFFPNQEKRKLQSLSFNFFQKIIQNSLPVVKSYIDDLVIVSSTKHEPVSSSAMKLDEIVNRKQLRSDIAITQQNKKKCSEQELANFFQNMFLFLDIKDPDDNYVSECMSLNSSFYEQCSITEECLDFELQMVATELEKRLIEETVEPPMHIQPHSSDHFSNFLIKLKEDLIAEMTCASNKDMSYQDCKFSLHNMCFFKPEENMQIFGNDADLFDYMIPRLNNRMLGFQDTPSPSVQASEPKHERHDYSGLSLNERLVGKKIDPIIDERNIFIPSFSLVEEERVNTSENTYSSPSSKFKAVDPLLHMALEQFGKEILEGETSVKLYSKFTPSHKLTINEVKPVEQLIYATAIEHEFYQALTSMNHDISPRIFQINHVWVDQRTFALSMNEGGWIHPCVMDCFGYLTTTEQNNRRRDGTFGLNEILKHVVIKDERKLLMDPKLNCSDPELKTVFRLNNVGFRLENAGLVHIPIPVERQWILIVANFSDKSFDVLNPDNSIEKFSGIIKTVIHNFKQLFKKSYPGCFKFNIDDFSVKYAHVPKHNFRYDSGIFVIQFIRWYDGVEVKPFSNVDVQAIREKNAFRIVINKYNEQQLPLAKQFFAKHAPEFLH